MTGMPDQIASAFDHDMASVPVEAVTGDNETGRVMKLMAHMFLRVWTRLAIESGQKLTMTPFQYSLGTYHGQMNWVVNEVMNFEELPRILIGASYGRAHGLLAETYKRKDEDHVRLVFALDEEEVKGKPLAVNYLLYDAPARSFRFEEASAALRAALPKWFETVMTKSDEPLWTYCKENLECVGV
jgi:hypothetical protein